MRHWIAVRATTGEILHPDVPISGEPLRELSGTGSLRATIRPDEGLLRASDGGLLLEQWDTKLFLEDDGFIRWGGIITDASWDGPEWEIVGAGLSAYPYGQPFLGEFSGVGVDPADVVRTVWAHLQAYEDGDLGVTVEGSTSARVGTETKEQDKLDANGDPVKDAAGNRVKETVPVPYELAWWDTPDCGTEIARLAREAPFEWVERHAWNADKSGIVSKVLIADRIGARRDGLVFEQGVNVTNPVPYSVAVGDVATEVVALGAGEGRESLRASAAVRGSRLRRARVIEMKDVRDAARLRSEAQIELAASGGVPLATRITVANHPHAAFGSWDVGDVIELRANVPWLGSSVTWQRVMAWRQVSPTQAVVDLV